MLNPHPILGKSCVIGLKGWLTCSPPQSFIFSSCTVSGQRAQTAGLWSKNFHVKLIITSIKEFQFTHERTCKLKLKSTLKVPGGRVNWILHIWFVYGLILLRRIILHWPTQLQPEASLTGICLLLSYLIMKAVLTKKQYLLFKKKKSPHFCLPWHRRNGRLCLKWHNKPYFTVNSSWYCLLLIYVFLKFLSGVFLVIRIYQPDFKISFSWSKCKSLCFEKHRNQFKSIISRRRKIQLNRKNVSSHPQIFFFFFSVITNILLTLLH